MSEDIKMADFEIIDYAAGSDPKAIRLEQEVFKQKLIVKQVSKKNVELTQQVAELRAALSECRKYIDCDINNRLKPHNPSYLVKLADKALKENQ